MLGQVHFKQFPFLRGRSRPGSGPRPPPSWRITSRATVSVREAAGVADDDRAAGHQACPAAMAAATSAGVVTQIPSMAVMAASACLT